MTRTDVFARTQHMSIHPVFSFPFSFFTLLPPLLFASFHSTKKQRPHPTEKIQDEEGAHEVDTGGCCSGSCDVLAGERLPKQRPHGDDHPEHNSEEHLVAQVAYQGEEAGSIVLHSSSNVSEFKNDNKEAHVTASAAAKGSEEFPDKDAEILRLIEERRSTPSEEKQRLKDLGKCIKNASEKKNEEKTRHPKNP